MTPVPKKKHTRSRSNIRKNFHAKRVLVLNLGKCESCAKPKESHKACPWCGFYKK